MLLLLLLLLLVVAVAIAVAVAVAVVVVVVVIVVISQLARFVAVLAVCYLSYFSVVFFYFCFAPFLASFAS